MSRVCVRWLSHCFSTACTCARDDPLEVIVGVKDSTCLLVAPDCPVSANTKRMVVARTYSCTASAIIQSIFSNTSIMCGFAILIKRVRVSRSCLVCSTPDLLLSLDFVPRQLFLEVERRSVSAHSAINSYRTQHGNYRMCGAFDTPTQSATKYIIVTLLLGRVSLYSSILPRVSLYSSILSRVSLYSSILSRVSLYSSILSRVSLYSSILSRVSLYSSTLVLSRESRVLLYSF